MQTNKFYIGGRWVDPESDQTVDVINPATGDAFASISIASHADMEKAVAAARVAFQGFSQTSQAERVALLERITACYAKRRDDIGRVMIEEAGFPTSLAMGAQAAMGTLHFEHMIKVARNYKFTEQRGTTRVVKEPIGVVAMITPWNWPINQIACKVAPAIAAGCTMILKPSQLAPLNALLFAEVMDEAGVPPGVFNLINADGRTVGNALCGHKDVDMVSFTGSTGGGISVAKEAADTVKRVHQELGGKSPFVVMPDADLKKAVRDAIPACFLNTGQSCNAPTRLLVPATRMRETMMLAKEAAEEQRLAEPEDETSTLGPVINARQKASIEALIETGIDEGATLVCGGPGMPEGFETGYYVRPTIFANVTPDMTLFREEVFGPVLTISGYDSVDHAAELANDTDYGLAGYIHGTDVEAVRDMALRIRAGTIHVNSPDWDADAPFGGYKMSGNGREYADFAMNDFLEIKGVVGWGN